MKSNTILIKTVSIFWLCCLFFDLFGAEAAQINSNNQIFLYRYGNNPTLFSTTNPNKSIIKDSDKLAWFEPDYPIKAAMLPNDTYFSKQWYLNKIKAPEAWNTVRNNNNIIIAVIDSGVDIGHEDLVNNIWQNQVEIAANGQDDDNNGFIDDTNGWDFVDNTNDPRPKFEPGYTDEVNHGTLVAGLIAAEGNNATGVTGVVWRAKIMALRVLDDKGEGKVSSVIKAIDYAITNNASIINLSFVGLSYSHGLNEAIKRAYDAGIILVAAAGNESDNKNKDVNLNNQPMYPVCMDGSGENRVIGVAATDAMDQKTYFSGYGSNCVDITAPGISFFSTVATVPKSEISDQLINKKYDGFWSGTSMATPLISGGLALISAANPSFTRQQVINALFAGAENINKLNPLYNQQLGHGRINLLNSIDLAQAPLKNQHRAIVVAPATPGKEKIKIMTPEGKLITSFALPKIFASSTLSLNTADVNNDGLAEIIIGNGSGQNNTLGVFNQKGKLLLSFSPYAKSFRGGIQVATGDVDGDGRVEIITAPGKGGGPHVKIFSDQKILKGQFMALPKNFTGGIQVATGDVDGDGRVDIVITPLTDGSEQVRYFTATGKLLGQFTLKKNKQLKGLSLAVGDIDGGFLHKKDEFILASRNKGLSNITILSDQAVTKFKWLAFDKNYNLGVTVSSADMNQDGLAEIITSAASGGSPHIRIFSTTGELQNSFFAYNEGYSGGVIAAPIELDTTLARYTQPMVE
ncbi:MAG: S8 family serine peptidase [Candidatus Falkowbacteria bacterium]